MDKPELPELPELPKTPGMQEAPRPRDRLIQARMQRKLSQRQVAERLETTHINVSRWERGITKPNPYFRRKLVHLFGQTEEELDLADRSENVPARRSPLENPPGSPDPTGMPAPPGSALPTPYSSPLSPSQAASSIIPSPVSAPQLLDPTTPVLPPHPLVGREGDLAKLKDRLCSGKNVTLTALNGLPGVGKTTLSIAIAHDAEAQAYFRDGILWAGLGPQPNLSGISSHWCALLGISQAEAGESDSEKSLENMALALRRAIGSCRMLLIIDDAWTPEDVLALKVGGPNCAHLITTRFPFIANQLGPDSAVTIKELDDNEGMQLLSILAPQAVERETQKARDLVRAVGKLPLALTLMGNYLRRHTYSGQPRRVEAALERLSDTTERLYISEPHGIVDRHPSLSPDTPISLASVISVTYAQLDPEQQASLRALSVLSPKPESFTEETALAMTSRTTDLLDFLVDTGLLEISESSHYTMHQTIADYANAQLDKAARTTLREHLIDYIIALVSGYKKDYARLEQESSAILAALEAAYELGKSEALMSIIYAFIPYLRSRGLYALAEKHLRRALEMAEQAGDDYGKTGALLYLGEIAQKQGNYEQASRQLEDGLALARQVGEKERITALLADLGWVTWKRGEYKKAAGYLRDGLDLAREIDDKEHLCDILETLGSLAASRGDYTESMQYMEDALPIAKALEDSEKTCTLLINLGVTEGEKGNYEKAEEYFLEGLEIARRIGHKEWVSLLLSNLGDIASEREDYNLAENYFQEGLIYAQQTGNPEWMSVLLSNLGLISQKQGLYVLAEEYLKKSLDIAKQINRPHIISNTLYAFGNLYLDWKQASTAEDFFRNMLDVIPNGSQDLIALAQYGMARAFALQGYNAEAHNAGMISLEILETMGHRSATEVKDWLYHLNI